MPEKSYFCISINLRLISDQKLLTFHFLFLLALYVTGAFCEKGSIVLIHAHGDNIDKLEKYVPRFKYFIATTQAKPFDKVYNFGGFSDGDGCVFVAREFGSKIIRLASFDFEDNNVNPIKKKKLKCANKIIGMAEF